MDCLKSGQLEEAVAEKLQDAVAQIWQVAVLEILQDAVAEILLVAVAEIELVLTLNCHLQHLQNHQVLVCMLHVTIDSVPLRHQKVLKLSLCVCDSVICKPFQIYNLLKVVVDNKIANDSSMRLKQP